MNYIKIILLGILFFIGIIPSRQDINQQVLDDALGEVIWVDSVFNEMTIDEKIGQLFMIRAHSDKGPGHIAHVQKMISTYHVGGLCFFQGTPIKQVNLLNKYQQLSKIPLMVSMDAEWGLGMRLKKHTISFPRQLMLGAIQDNREVYKMGKEVARELLLTGVHINFAPVIDVNNNAANPVINNRSFGENPVNVAIKGYAYMRGLQDHGVMACAKHFPGHGDTNVDSHAALPIISHSKERLDSVELYPFSVLFQHQLSAVMVAHLDVPILGTTALKPTTLSHKVVNDLLKDEMGFEGLVFTDAMEMKALSEKFPSGEVEAMALQAGNDIILLPRNLPKAVDFIKTYIKKGKITIGQINKSVKKILRSKYHYGLTKTPVLDTAHLMAALHTPEAIALKQQLMTKAITLVRDTSQLIPVHYHDNQSITTLSIGVKKKSTFQKRLEQFGPSNHYQLPHNEGIKKRNQLLNELSKKKTVIVSVHNMSKYAKKRYGIPKNIENFIHELNKNTNMILVLFGSPYSLEFFDDCSTVVMAYDEDIMAQDVTAQAVIGASSIEGRLPITASSKSKFGDGEDRFTIRRLGYSIPEFVGLNSDTLQLIDSLVDVIISTKAAPGCQVLVAKSGKVVFHKAYGYHTYEKQNAVKLSDVYDLASITKVAASTIALMKLHDDGMLDLGMPIKEYFPELDTTAKGDLNFRDILAHHAGLKAWIAFYKSTMIETPKGVIQGSKYYSPTLSEEYSLKVCNDLFLCSWYPDTIWDRIIKSPLRDNKNYKYSDLAFYLAARLVKTQTGKRLDEYVFENFYMPMHLSKIGFNPLKRSIPLNEIPPTEEDDYFRLKKVNGTVHDMGAAMLDGVSGHAGLFSNAEDLAALMQMMLNKGVYEDKRLLSSEVFDIFLERHPRSSRRALGFDMKEMNIDKSQNMAEEASEKAFGHLGFTGTAVWADPKQDIVYVFLSNRTYPTMHNSKLHKENYRPKIQSIIYRALITEQ